MPSHKPDRNLQRHARRIVESTPSFQYQKVYESLVAHKETSQTAFQLQEPNAGTEALDVLLNQVESGCLEDAASAFAALTDVHPKCLDLRAHAAIAAYKAEEYERAWEHASTAWKMFTDLLREEGWPERTLHLPDTIGNRPASRAAHIAVLAAAQCGLMGDALQIRETMIVLEPSDRSRLQALDLTQPLDQEDG